MFTLLVVLLIAGAAITVFLWVGTLFLQGYFYTEPTQGIHWQAPAAGAVLTAFLTVWCVAVVFADSTPSDIPYDALHRFSPRVEMLQRPTKKLWAIKKDGKVVEYVNKRTGQNTYEYRDTTFDNRPWNSSGVVAIEMEQGGEKLRFDLAPATEYAYRQFVSPGGWVMQEYDTGPTGVPSQFRYGRFVANLFFNGFHAALWFACLWVLLRFQWTHALGLAVVIWVTVTLTLLPMLLSQAAEVSVARRAAAPPAPANVSIEVPPAVGCVKRTSGCHPVA